MKENEYFKINSIEELKKVYEMFEDRWTFSLKEEIKDFNNGYRYVIYGHIGMYLVNYIPSAHTEIKYPVRNINNLNKLI